MSNRACAPYRSLRLPHAGVLAIALALAATGGPASAADLGGLGGTLTGAERYKETMASKTPTGKLKKKVISHGKDAVTPIIAFATGGTTASGPFTITDYEDFPVTGTWTLTSSGQVTLAVDPVAFAAQKGPELCPGASCTPTATWTPRAGKLNPRTNTLKAKWFVSFTSANADGSYLQETFAFKGAGKLAP